MRHIASLLAGLIIAPVTWLLIGAGTIGLDPNGLYQDVQGKASPAIAVGLFAVAGLLLGALVVPRMSPVGPLLVTVFFGGAFALYRFTSFHLELPNALEAVKIPVNSSAVAGESGAVLVIATLMVVTAFVPSRWRRKQSEDDRVVDTAELATGSGVANQPAEQPDPYAGTTRTLTAEPVDNRVHNPFDQTTQQQPYTASPQPETRSPYADDAYGYDPQIEYRDTPSRYGDTQQQSGYDDDNRRYR
jgi:hypothetical protein